MLCFICGVYVVFVLRRVCVCVCVCVRACVCACVCVIDRVDGVTSLLRVCMCSVYLSLCVLRSVCVVCVVCVCCAMA